MTEAMQDGRTGALMKRSLTHAPELAEPPELAAAWAGTGARPPPYSNPGGVLSAVPPWPRLVPAPVD